MSCVVVREGDIRGKFGISKTHIPGEYYIILFSANKSILKKSKVQGRGRVRVRVWQGRCRGITDKRSGG